MDTYIEWHASSAFSFLRGASLPEEYALRASQLELPALALLDRDGLYGAPRFYNAALRSGIKAHLGAEITTTDGCQYPLIVENRTGYQNLSRLITKMKLRAPKGQGAVTLDEIEEYNEGLHCLTGDQNGPLYREIAMGGEPCRWLDRMRSIFGEGRLHVELQRHYLRDQESFNLAAIALAGTFKLPLLATNGVRYALRSQSELLDAFTAIRNKTTLQKAGTLLAPNRERYLKSAPEMKHLFYDLPSAIDHGVHLCDRISYSLADLGYEFPAYPVPQGHSMNSFLRARAWEGAQSRYRLLHEAARQQIEKELTLIERLNIAGYFLIVWDIIRFCKENGILVQGRGSAANSAVCYSLGITAVDPVGMDLLFERFLSEERGEWPDIDIDLPSGERRERAIQYVYERYGQLGAAMTANVITYRSRSAARELGKVLGFDEPTITRLAKLCRGWEWHDPTDTPASRFQRAGFAMNQQLVRKYLDLFIQMQDLPRHLGQHSGGLVICEGQLDRIVPLEPATMPGRVVVQWDKDDCADMKMLKVDLLGLGMMAVVQDTLEYIEKDYGETVDLALIPKDDPKVFAMMQEADTIGLFQVESRAQMATLPRLQPKCYYDLVVEVAIIRPGPIVGKMVHPYIRRRQGREEVTYFHPLLEPVLRRTLGVPLFQEQLLRMSMIIAGFSGGQAEELRRAFTHKRSERKMKEVEVRLREGMTRNGVSPTAQDTIVQSFTGFALYGFPESHAASFALIAYSSGYLKTHYLAAFTCAILNNQPMGFYHPATLVKDAQRHGLKVLPVDVTCSGVQCSLEKGEGNLSLRLGLNYVRGLRSIAARAIADERQRSPFRSISNLVQRVKTLHQDEIRQLAAVGAFNSLPSAEPIHRRRALWEVEAAMRPVGPIFEQLELDMDPIGTDCPLPVMNPGERLVSDYRGTGLTIGRHPMSYLRAQFTDPPLTPSNVLPTIRNGSQVAVGGAVICRQRPGTANGFFFVSLEDEFGIANLIFVPDLFNEHRLILTSEAFLYVEGILQNVDRVVSVKVQRVRSISADLLSLPALPTRSFH